MTAKRRKDYTPDLEHPIVKCKHDFVYKDRGVTCPHFTRWQKLLIRLKLRGDRL